MSKKVLVAIADGTEELEAVTIIDVLRRAEADVTVASVGTKQVTASRCVNLVADAVISDCVGNTYDLIALPGISSDFFLGNPHVGTGRVN